MEVDAIHAVVLLLELRDRRGATDGGGDAQPAEARAAVMHAGVVVVAVPVVDQQQTHGFERREAGERRVRINRGQCKQISETRFTTSPSSG
jgi:predicted dinucleotide-binding enzyme